MLSFCFFYFLFYFLLIDFSTFSSKTRQDQNWGMNNPYLEGIEANFSGDQLRGLEGGHFTTFLIDGLSN